MKKRRKGRRKKARNNSKPKDKRKENEPNGSEERVSSLTHVTLSLPSLSSQFNERTTKGYAEILQDWNDNRCAVQDLLFENTDDSHRDQDVRQLLGDHKLLESLEDHKSEHIERGNCG